MSQIVPGEDVPYTLAEIFLSSEYGVGQGLSTFGRLNDSQLESKNTFKEVRDDFDTLCTVRYNERTWEQLVRSAVVKKLAESEFTVEYVAKHAPDIPENEFEDVKDLIEYSNLAHVDRETIEWVLNTHMTHIAIWQDQTLWRRLIKNHETWMDYFVNLTTFGNPLNRLDAESILLLATHSVGAYGEDPYEVFSRTGVVDEFLNQSNGLDSRITRNHGVPTSHEGWIRGRSNEKNMPFSASGWSADRYRSSEYTNGRAIRLLDESYELRKIIAQGRLGLNDPNFEFTDLFDGSALDNFWDFDFDYEFINDARASSNSSSDDRGRTVNASGNIDTSNSIRLEANADSRSRSNNGTASADETVYLETRNFDVSNKNAVKIRLNGNVERNTDSDSYNTWNSTRNVNTSAESSCTLDIGNDSKTFKGNDDVEDTEFDISNENSMKLRFEARSDANARAGSYWGWDIDTSASVSIDITDVSFEE